MSRSGALLLALALTACGDDSSAPDRPADAAPSAERPRPADLREAMRGDNLLLVTFDTTRADRLGCYGHEAAITPGIDGLARRGVRFARAMTTAPVTLPSHTSVLTGLYPIAHGVRDNSLFVAGEGLYTLPEALREEGYATAAFVSAEVLHARYGLDQGFDHYDDRMPTVQMGGASRVERDAATTTEAALAWLRGREGPWFVWVHYFDPHEPLIPPEPFRRGSASPYDAEIRFADHQLGRLLAALEPVAEDTLVCLTADHGESLGQHLEQTHGLFAYDATMCVPLLFAHPALPAGRVVDGQVSVVDLYPTLLELLGADSTEDLVAGSSLVDALAGVEDEVWHDAYLEALNGCYSFGLAPIEGISRRGEKLILTTRSELYDLEGDPGETRNLFAARPERVAALRQGLEALRGGRDPTPPPPGVELDPAQLQMLIELGYVDPDAPRLVGSDVDPKDFVRLMDQRSRASALAAARRWPEAEALLRQVLEKAPQDAPSLGLLGHIQFVTDRLEEAEKNLLLSISLRNDQSGAYYDLAKICRRRGDLPAALRHLEATVQHAPSFREAYDLAIKLCERRKDEEAAAEWRRRRAELGDG